MDEIDALKTMLRTGAIAHNVDPERAVSAFERLVGKTTPSGNKTLFYALCEVLGHEKTTHYTPARAKKLQLRLKTYSEDDMLKAAKAIANNDYMAGSNGRKYGTIDYLLRNDEKIDEWLQQAAMVKQQQTRSNPPAAVPKAITQAAEVQRANPEAVAEAKRKLYEKMGIKKNG